MLRTVEALIDEKGRVHLLEQVKLDAPRRALLTILNEQPRNEMQRPYGLCAGEFIVPEDFDAPLPEELLNLFEGR